MAFEAYEIAGISMWYQRPKHSVLFPNDDYNTLIVPKNSVQKTIRLKNIRVQHVYGNCSLKCGIANSNRVNHELLVSAQLR